MDTETNSLILQQQRLWNSGQPNQHVALAEGQGKDGSSCRRWWSQSSNTMHMFSPSSRARSCPDPLDLTSLHKVSMMSLAPSEKRLTTACSPPRSPIFLVGLSNLRCIQHSLLPAPHQVRRMMQIWRRASIQMVRAVQTVKSNCWRNRQHSNGALTLFPGIGTTARFHLRFLHIIFGCFWVVFYILIFI